MTKEVKTSDGFTLNRPEQKVFLNDKEINLLQPIMIEPTNIPINDNTNTANALNMFVLFVEIGLKIAEFIFTQISS